MNTNEYLLHWLVESAAFGFFILAIGTAAAYWRRSPVERLRLIEWTFVACAAMALVRAVPGVPSWSLGMWGTRAVSGAQVDEPREIEVSQVAGSSENDVRIDQRPAEIKSNEFVQPQPLATEQVENSRTDDQRAETLPPETQRADVPIPVTAVARAETSAEINWGQLLIVGYLFVAALLAARTLFGFVRLNRIDRAAKPVPAEVNSLFDSIVGQASAAKKLGVRLRMSSQVELPLAYGVWRPTILLPQRMCEALQQNSSQQSLSSNVSSTAAELRYALAHEWSHLERGDVLRWRLAAALGILFFYQPAYWWLRKQMRLCQDFLADSRAAEQSPVREDYAQFLVRLAQRQLGMPVGMALGIGDKRSSLFRRVKMVLDSDRPLAQRLRWPRNLAIACTALLLAAIASAVRLTAEETPPKNLLIAQNQTRAAAQTVPNENAKAKTGAAKADGVETVTCSGEVNDALVGKPIAGAKVTVWRESERGTVSKELNAITDGEGKFTVQMPTNDPLVYTRRTNQGVSGSFSDLQTFKTTALPYALRIQHPEYATQRRTGSVTLREEVVQTPDNERVTAGAAAATTVAMAGAANLGKFGVRPGSVVSGTVISADGTPAPGVKVFAHSMAPKNERTTSTATTSGRSGFGDRPPVSAPPPAIPRDATLVSQEETETDANGKFQVNMISPGEGALWITPEKDFVPQAKVLYDRRGDLGNITLERGTPIRGTVTNLQGKPLPGVFLRLASLNPIDPKYSARLTESPRRFVETDAVGNFTMGPLPPGAYKLEAQEYLDDHPALRRQSVGARRELPGLFVPRKIPIVVGEENPPITYQESPAVTVKGKVSFEDAANIGNLRNDLQRSNPRISGTIAGMPYTAVGVFDKDGNITINAPRGMENATLQFGSAGGGRGPDLQNQMQWRLSPDVRFKTEQEIQLGTLDKDVPNLEIEYRRETPGGRGRRGIVVEGGGSPGGRGRRPQAPSAKSARPPEPLPDELTVVGNVQDADSRQPVAETKVTAFLEQRSPDEPSTYFRLGEAVSNVQGEVRFQLPTKYARDTAEGKKAWIRLTAEHPDYANWWTIDDLTVSAPLDYPESTLVELGIHGNERNLRFPIRMQRGEEVSGTVKSADGTPAAGIRVFADGSRSTPQRTLTDRDGKFKLRLLKPVGTGSGAVDREMVEIFPGEQGTSTQTALGERRGDLGTIQLQDGPRVTGRVLDAAGKPLASISLSAYGVQPNGDRAYSQHRVAKTNANGEFAFAPMKPGVYQIGPTDNAYDLTKIYELDQLPLKQPLPGLFVPRKVTLVEGERPAALEFRVSPTVVIEGQVRVGRNGPRPTDGNTTDGPRNLYRPFAPKIVGVVNGEEYVADVVIDNKGNFTTKVPRDMTEVQVKLADQYNHGPQYRRGKNKPLIDPSAIQLGKVDEDIRDLEIVYPEQQR